MSLMYQDVPNTLGCFQHTGMTPTHWDIPDTLGYHHHSELRAQSTELGFVLCAFSCAHAARTALLSKRRDCGVL